LACAPAAALLLGAAIVSYRSPEPAAGARAKWATAGVLVAVAVAAIVAIAIPFGMTSAIRSSQAEASAGQLNTALSDALTAQNLEPYAATPRLQQALVYEQAHDYKAARAPITEAVAREPTNWRLWLVRARIDAESGHPRAAVRDYRRAHALDPLEPGTAE
jgi:Tfp pilus assembly protein PilF